MQVIENFQFRREETVYPLNLLLLLTSLFLWTEHYIWAQRDRESYHGGNSSNLVYAKLSLIPDDNFWEENAIVGSVSPNAIQQCVWEELAGFFSPLCKHGLFAFL